MIRCCLILLFGTVSVFSGFSQKQLRLENENLVAVFDEKDGSLIRLTNKQTGWDIVGRAQLGQSFELLAPLEGRRYHRINGKEQAPPIIRKTENGIVFTWRSMKSKFRESVVDITFTGVVTLTPEGLLYSGEIANNDELTVEYLSWPFLGEVTIPDKQQPLVCQNRNRSTNLFPSFHSEHGYWGVEYPTNCALLPENAFLLIRNNEQGIYICSEQGSPSEMVIGSFELIPGFDLPRLNPLTEEMDGQPVRIQFKANHVIYNQPRTTTVIKPLTLEPYSGDWHKGADRYLKWKQRLPAKSVHSGWISQPLTWRKVTIANGNELVNYAKEAQRNGVSVLLVNGWMKMGQQSNLEIADGFLSALNECRALGVKIVPEINPTTVDYNSLWYKNVLSDEIMTDPYGIPYDLRIVCPNCLRLTSILEQEYNHHSAITAADGLIFNDNQHPNKTYFCFNPNHGHAVPAFADHGIDRMDGYFAEWVRSKNPDAVTLGYGLYDTQNGYYDGYFINQSASKQSLQRYINPGIPLIASVDVRTARQDMNNCLKNRYNLCYDLRFYSNSLDTYPQIMEYGKQIEKLRNQYREFIWEGNFEDTAGATLKGDPVAYAVYARKSDGRKAVVILNNSESQPASLQVSFNGSRHALETASPEQPQPTDYQGTLTIQPQSAVIVVEK